jgi:hypothetical protein
VFIFVFLEIPDPKINIGWSTVVHPALPDCAALKMIRRPDARSSPERSSGSSTVRADILWQMGFSPAIWSASLHLITGFTQSSKTAGNPRFS